ncbi:MAG: D-glycero-beta-D-manno-heptose 1,7-bisphosphate 7-phosphatase [Deltaproteobacteria bacterium]|nr:D-glycero-beta-D-manno-heptose 1,7-bisphosphate 7-phosphatase [Deltaproteobacteria bacterium]TLN05256.1 MAG: D-glycero-beta-D-manno-heptose 1,7-bisphosphate 7-phosphatase [bacterium]
MVADNAGKTLQRAVFLDRDGVINVEKGYLHRIEDFEFLPGVPLALRLLKEAGFLLVVVTNQSGVARGYYSLETVHELHRHLQSELVVAGVTIDGFYICPHHPEHGSADSAGECNCRKPLPGMIERAISDFRIDPTRSYLIGDKLSDIEAGRAAGCRSLLVRTGYGAAVVQSVPQDVTIVDDLPAAARFILGEEIS